jgi:predicted O-linked N-acetylglucosamine transferase (SPINDLY family)
MNPTAAHRHARLLQQGLALQQAGRIEEAAGHYRAVLAEDPSEANALQLLGLTEKAQGRLDEAARLMAAALAVRPDEPAVLNNLGNTLRELGRLAEARDCLERAVELQPDYGEAWNNLGNVFKDAADYGPAAERYRQALALRPDYPDALNNLAGILHRQGDLNEAARLYRLAIARRPDFAMAHYNLANVLTDAGLLDQAIAHFRRAVALAPDYVEAINGLLRQLQTVCEWPDLAALTDRLLDLGVSSGKVFPFSFLALPSTLAQQRQCARRWVARQYAAYTGDAARHPYSHRQAAPGERIRLGYLSSDLHDHATAYLMAEVFELHDRARFEVHALSLGADDGKPMRQRLLAAFEHFHDLSGLSWREAADRIHGLGIDILVDLKGYTKDTGSPIMAFRPAPVQVNYLGYPGTMGADFIDYVLTDRTVTPPEDQAWFDERFAYLPHSYQCNDRRRPIGARPSRAECGLPETGFVYCCFNHTYKITPEMFGVWCEILSAVPDSVLWLLKSNRWAEANLRREAEARGIDPERLVFADNLPLDRHLGRLQNADLCLDTRPYNAHTTTSDALWAGVPVLTWPGDTFAARVAASLLKAAGLPQLVAPSRAAYRALAIGIAGEPILAGEFKRHLAERRLALPLFDSPAFTGDLEALYTRMWQRHLAHLPPEPLA